MLRNGGKLYARAASGWVAEQALGNTPPAVFAERIRLAKEAA